MRMLLQRPPITSFVLIPNLTLFGSLTRFLPRQSEASVSDLNKEIAKAKSQQSRGLNDPTALRALLGTVPGMGSSDLARQMDGVERMSRAAEPGQGGKKPEDMTPEELVSCGIRLFQVSLKPCFTDVHDFIA